MPVLYILAIWATSGGIAWLADNARSLTQPGKQRVKLATALLAIAASLAVMVAPR